MFHSSSLAMLSEGSKTSYTFTLNWLLLLSLVAFVSSMAVDRGDYWVGPAMEKRQTMRFQACGSQLNSLIDLVCAGKFASMFPDKRSTDLFGFYRHNTNYRNSEKHLGLRNKRQVVDECCRRSCTQDVLEQYCEGR